MRLERAINISDLERLARKRLPPIVFDYLAGGAEDERTLRGTADAFSRYSFQPSILPGAAVASLAVELFGERIDSPFIVGPTGLNGIFRHDADVALARAAHRAGAAFVLSSASNVALEEVAARSTGLKWFQLYPWGDRLLSTRLMQRAWSAGYRTLVVTVDAIISGKRERDLRNGFAHELRISPRAVWQGVTHPRWLFNAWLPRGMPRFANIAEFAAPGASAAALAEFVRSRKNPALSWDDLAYFREQWRGAFLIKGILGVPDALRAQAMGADGIVISNHGGRQLDGAIDTLRALEYIAPAVKGGMVLLADGGFRRGADVVRALALGARAVVLGRAPLYGLAAGGQPGVERALHILREETQRTLGLLGCRAIEQLSREHLLIS